MTSRNLKEKNKRTCATPQWGHLHHEVESRCTAEGSACAGPAAQTRVSALSGRGEYSELLNDERRPSPHQLLWGSKWRLWGQVLAWWSLLGQPTDSKIILDELSSNVELRPCSRWQGPEHHRFSVSEQWSGPHFTAWTLSCRAFAPPSRGTSD